MTKQEGIRILSTKQIDNIIETAGTLKISRKTREILEILEQFVDAEFKRIGITPKIYHFRTDVIPFTSVTIVDEIITRASARTKLNTRLSRYFMEGEKTPATYLIKSLREIAGISGVAICDKRDQFNSQRGRIIAKGRLVKHLKEMGK